MLHLGSTDDIGYPYPKTTIRGNYFFKSGNKIKWEQKEAVTLLD